MITDQPVLKEAREDAFAIIAADPSMEQESNALVKKFYQSQFADKEKLILY